MGEALGFRQTVGAAGQSRRAFLIATAGLMTLADARAIGIPGRAFAATREFQPLPRGPSDGYNVWDMSQAGYVSEEYLISGTADVLEPVAMSDAPDMSKRDAAADGSSRDFKPRLIQPAVPYTTRLIVYRPKDPARFSGNVVTEVLHISGGGMAAAFLTAQPAFVANGDIGIGVQHPLNLAGLRAADPARYGSVQAAHPTQIWGMVRDAGRLAKEGGLAGLRGYRVRQQILTGRSYTGVAAATFANMHHAEAKLSDGRNVFDGYLPITSGYFVRPLDVPVIRINTESEFNRFGLQNRGVDSDHAGSKARLYEIAGTCHGFPSAKPIGAPPKPAQPPAAVAGTPRYDPGACLASFGPGARHNDLPGHVIVAQAYANLFAWARGGPPPPRSERFAVEADGRPHRDTFGNTIGGVRTPYVDVAVGAYGPGEGSCSLDGYMRPMSAEALRRIYGDPESYVGQFRARTEALVKANWIGPDAVPLMMQDARRNAEF